jgi:hypothetical protein
VLFLAAAHAQFLTSYTSQSTRRKESPKRRVLLLTLAPPHSACQGATCSSDCGLTCVAWGASADSNWAQGAGNNVPYTAKVHRFVTGNGPNDRSQWLEGNNFVIDGGALVWHAFF